MEQITYEKPREKLQSRGVSFLTTVELLQLILGSGSAHSSGARLAKRAMQVIEEFGGNYQKLYEISGIGIAKASQIIAALELGTRINAQSHLSRPRVSASVMRQDAAKYRHAVIIAYFFDGSEHELDKKAYHLKDRNKMHLQVKIIARDALTLNARSLIVAIGSKDASFEVTIQDLDLIKNLKNSLLLIAIQINAVYQVNTLKVERWTSI